MHTTEGMSAAPSGSEGTPCRAWGAARGHDQADGLRRLVSGTSTRVVALFGMQRDAGASLAAANLAAALAQQGRAVVLLDERAGDAGSASAVWALRPDGPAGRAARAACGVEVLAADPAAAWPAAHELRALCEGGVVLIDAALDAAGHLSARAQAADELVLVLQPHAAALTAAYAGVKRLHYAHGIRQLRFLVQGARSVDEAVPVMTNLARTGSRYLAVSLEAAGWIRADAHHADAQRLRQSVVEAFPASPAAQDFRRLADAVGRWPWRAAPSPALAPGNASSPVAAASAAPTNH